MSTEENPSVRQKPRICRTGLPDYPAEIRQKSAGLFPDYPASESGKSRQFAGRTDAEKLVAAGWKQQPDGKWRSPDTNHDWPERVALLLASLPRLTTASQLVRRSPRRFSKR